MIELDKAQLARLEARLHDVGEKIAKKAMRSAARKAMKKVRDDARAHAPKDTGLLDENFTLVTQYRNGTIYAKVGVKGGARKNPTTPYYFRMVELGTKDMPAAPFLRPTLEDNAEGILDTLVQELNAALDRA